MRNRNNRIAVRVTNKEFDRINEMASKSIFPKEKLIRLIIEGYPIQEKPSADYVQLWCALWKLNTTINNFFIRGAVKSTSEKIEETIKHLQNANYVSYDIKRKKKKGVKL